MNIVTHLNEWRAIRQTLADKIGLIPTMGHLHQGHLELCQRSRCENLTTVVSIFVNPMQFNQASDYQTYPRTLEVDFDKLQACGVDYVLVPDAKEMYPDEYEVRVTETNISQVLEGEYRPGHFDGMLTVIMKLFNLVKPSRAYFGVKDFQQLMLIQKMVAALFMPVDVIACETVRATDGLALSSRNSRLTKEQREKAILFPKLLSSTKTLDEIKAQLISHGFKVDYIAEEWQRRLGAVWLGDVRLIDNMGILGKSAC